VTASDEDLAFLGAARQAALIRAKQISPVELVRIYLARIERLDPSLGAYITVCREAAEGAARRAEGAVMRGERLGPLHGVTFAVKDQFDTAGVRTTSGSRLLEHHVPARDATVVARLAAAGGILLGKLNLTEFALGGTIRFPFGQPRNPWNLAHDPGGSSSGSGIATAAALCAASLGEDTGGSIRSPASFCGVVGLRPTWGRVSRHGSFPLAWSMDAAGPITRTVEDAALLLQAIAGEDADDPLTSRRPVPDYRASLTGEVRGLRVGLVRELVGGAETDAEVRRAVLDAAQILKTRGALLDEVSMPTVTYAGAVFMALCDSEGAGGHLRWLRERAAEYDQGTRRRLLTAALLPAALLHRAGRARAAIRREVLAALARCDVLLCPTAPRPAAPIADMTARVATRDEVAGRFFTRRSYSSPASLAGVPAIALPAGFSSGGLPIGAQLMGRPFAEDVLLRAAHVHEQATAWHHRRPPTALRSPAQPR
jgi:aspartyl-tRNA(Asn)/glutamyl-tRNA(Gln) amidotransferase subunit A